jgi:hypothetical protein
LLTQSGKHKHEVADISAYAYANISKSTNILVALLEWACCNIVVKIAHHPVVMSHVRSDEDPHAD